MEHFVSQQLFCQRVDFPHVGPTWSVPSHAWSLALLRGPQESVASSWMVLYGRLPDRKNRV